MLANTVTASAREAPASTGLGAAAVIGYPSSRRASSSALIAEISASTALDLLTAYAAARAPPPPAPPAHTAAAPDQPFRREVDVGAVRFALGAAAAGRPHRRVCSTSDPVSTSSARRPAAPPADAAAPATPASTRSTDRSCVSFITQEYVVTRHDNQQPRIARVTPPSVGQTPRTDNRCRRTGGSPRSVHDRGTVTCPPTPPAHTNTVSPRPALDEQTPPAADPISGWNG